MAYKTKSQEEKREEVKQALENINQGVKNIFDNEKFDSNFKEFLNTMSKFHNYSVNNQILIAFQNPNATHVAGFNTWKNTFHRTVNKGEKAIKVLAPAPFKVDKVDEDGNVVLDENGKPEKVEIMWYKQVPVFDISQTDGEPIKGLSFIDELEGEDLRAKVLIQAIKNVTDCEIQYGDTGAAKGYFKQDLDGGNRIIAISDGLSQMQEAKTLVHEFAHSEFHGLKTGELVDQSKSEKEISAEATAYAISRHFGLNTEDYSFAYVWSWNNATDKELKDVLNSIQKNVCELIDKLEPEFEKELSKELDKDEIALAIGDKNLHIQRTDGGFDYTIYNQHMRLEDGGVLDNAKNVFEAAQDIINGHNLKGNMKMLDIEKFEDAVNKSIQKEIKSVKRKKDGLER